MPSNRLYTPPSINDSTLPGIVFRKEHRPFTNILQRRRGEVQVGRHIVVCVAGSCLRNGQPDAEGRLGVYFGPESRHNMSGPLEGDHQGSNRAQLGAAILALQKIKQLLDDDKLETRFVLLATHCKYVVQGITEWIYEWYSNGWNDVRRSKISNREDFERLDELVDELEDDYGVFVKFWQVPRDHNEGAISKAREASGYHDSD